MGSVISAIRSVPQTLTAVTKILSDLNQQYQALLTRVNAAPGLPCEHPTRPYWLDDPPYPELVNVRSEGGEVPREADVVIIGSGITGVAVARGCYAASAEGGGATAPRVVVLEARELCGGATGRNGGHVKASPHELFPRLVRRFGREQAVRLIRFVLRTAEAVGEVGAGREVAEYRGVETVDFFLDGKGFEDVKRELERFHEVVPEFGYEVWERDEVKERFGVVGDHVFGAVGYKAGALWPYRLVVDCWRELMGKMGDRLKIETGTGVLDVQVGEDEKRPYVVKTSRGDIRARHVVHATNSHATQFLPGLRGKMAGIKGHMTMQRPGEQFVWQDGTKSWSFLYGGSMFDYVTQRPNGDVMLGGGFARSAGQGLDMVGVYDDRSTEAMTIAHVSGVMQTVFGEKWDGGVKRVWSGIMSVTGDMAPFVGRVPASISGRPLKTAGRGWFGNKRVKAKEAKKVDVEWEGAEAGEWISAGYCGDGMVWAWLCGTALGVMIAGKEDVVLEKGEGFPGGRLDDWFPRQLEPTEARVKKAGLSNLVDELT